MVFYMAEAKMSKTDMIKWIFNLGIPAILFLIPCGEIYTMPMKLFFVTTIFAILCYNISVFFIRR